MTFKRETLVDEASTTLNGGIGSGDTSVLVNDGSVFPSSGNFRCLIDSEIVRVTARSSNTLTVTRGAEGTTAATHSSGANVTAIITAGALKQYLQESAPFLPVATPAKLQDTSGNILTSSSFSWTNQGTATIGDDTYGGMTIKAPDNASAHSCRILRKTAPTAPAVVRAFFAFGPGYDGTTHDSTRLGLGYRESDTGKLFTIEFTPPGDTVGQGGHIRVMKYTNETTVSSEVVQANNIYDRLWLEIEDDNTDLYFRASIDDDTWHEFHTEARGTFLASAGPDQIGFYLNPYDAFASVGTAEAWAHVMAWNEI